MNIENKVLLITGANRGIGRGFLDAALQAGASKIYAAVRDPQTARLPADSRVVKLQLDLADAGSIAAAAQAAPDLDILVNNAGVFSFTSILSGDLEAIRRDMDTNFYGTIQVVRAFAPALIARGQGSVINLLSIVSWAAMAPMGSYSASKAALLSATQALRAELRPHNVSVVAVYPGPVETDMTVAVDMPKTGVDEVVARILADLEAGREDIFPDVMSQQLSSLWLNDSKGLERQFAAMGAG